MRYNKAMRKIIVLFFVVVLGGILLTAALKKKLYSDLDAPVIVPTVTSTVPIRNQKETISLFVPYWSLGRTTIETTSYDDIIYFGVIPTLTGLDTRETGYKSIDAFISSTKDSKKRYLALRMIGNDTNFAILKDTKAQIRIITETLALTKTKGFDGVVLDLEVGGFPFDSLIQQINAYVKNFYEAAKQNNTELRVAVYGDTFYRIRPYEIKTIGQYADKILLMAYDFHKASGSPGPNFPLSGKETYGYDLQEMADDFRQVVDNSKIIVIFGMFGYDWKVDSSGNSMKSAQALSLRDIETKFVHSCSFADCKIVRDSASSETEVRYKDSNNQDHIVWYEDMQSVKNKEQYLEQKGISSFSFWAYSYF